MIKSDTFKFLNDLAANNNRDWFQLNKSRHDDARLNVLEFAGKVILGLSKFDHTIPSSLDPKDCVMRIYRDVRFSKVKTPYKNNFGAGFSQNGKKFSGAGYYLHIQPEGSFIAGGCWMPEADLLKAIRQEIDYNGSDFRLIIEKPSFMKYYGNLESEYKLKTCPKGYDQDHPEIEFLKLKSFTFSHKLNNAELINSDSVEQIVNGFAKLNPYIAFLRNAIS
jgi:uncharacterized protein (TIGR02453 family)